MTVAIRASIDGTATPVTVVDTIRSTSSGRSPARSSAPSTAARTEVDRGLDERVVGRAEVVEVAVALERQRQVPGPDLGAGVKPLQELVLALGAEADVGEQLGDLALGVPVVGEHRLDGSDATHATTLRVRGGRGVVTAQPGADPSPSADLRRGTAP